MIAFPNAKINLGLIVKDKRPDGFHNLETVFYPVMEKDALEIIPSTNEGNEIIFSTSGLQIDGSSKNNLCVTAIKKLQNDFPVIRSLKIHLHKAIPMGAGLGGGSADAAFTLQLINKIYQLNLSQEILAAFALDLGSDCPFFLENKPALATGRGEILIPVPVDLSNYKICIINPGIHVSTKEAFQALEKFDRKESMPLSEAILLPVQSWKDYIINDFEQPVFSLHPEIEEIKNTLYNYGAVFSLMSGSGSSVYGIFNTQPVPEIQFPAGYFLRWV